MNKTLTCVIKYDFAKITHTNTDTAMDLIQSV